MSDKLQFRVVRNSEQGSVLDAKWRDAFEDGSFGYGVPELEGLSLQVRVKPSFEPGYYEANTTTHDVRWFTSPPENPAWKRVEVTRVGE